MTANTNAGKPRPVVRLVSGSAEAEQVSQTLARIWQVETSRSPVPADLVRVLASSGHYVACVWMGTRMVAAAVALRCASADGKSYLHSHVVGVLADVRDMHLGRALKSHQAEWCRERRLSQVRWTFDPNLQRNAHFNLHRLGARVIAFMANYYGQLCDGLNADTGDSDRVLVSWDVSKAPSPTVPTRTFQPRHVLDDSVSIPDPEVFEMPVVAVKIEETPTPSSRHRVRTQLSALLASGFIGVDYRAGNYIFAKEPDGAD